MLGQFCFLRGTGVGNRRREQASGTGVGNRRREQASGTGETPVLRDVWGTGVGNRRDACSTGCPRDTRNPVFSKNRVS
ncbi:MAG: hypothetical protein SXA11_08955 [Cyanobacteriota bacterium]|nr:hypothetical protein [Cyanobacteriota bacterium]